MVLLLLLLLSSAVAATTSASNESHTKQPRIIGGTPVTQADLQMRYPYTTSLQFGGHRCGGTLVADDLVLTAAHCVYLRLVRLNEGSCTCCVCCWLLLLYFCTVLLSSYFRCASLNYCLAFEMILKCTLSVELVFISFCSDSNRLRICCRH